MTMVGDVERCHAFAMKSIRLPAAVVLAAALLLSGACSADDDKGGAASSPTSATPKTELIEYDQEDAAGITIAKAADVALLEGAPDDFKQFVAGIIDGLKTPADDDCQFTVGVAKVDTSGFAVGSMHSCGGAMYIWAERDGVWQEIWSGQEYPICDDLKRYSVPKPIGGDKCYNNKDFTDLVDYTV
jgi:hypothetical protein